MRDINVKMFGVFTLSDGVNSISEIDNHSRKVWSLLAYLIYNRKRVVNREELLNLLWADSDQVVNSAGALKTLLHRIRGELDKLWDGAGKQLILSKGTGYCWNNEYNVNADYIQLEKVKGIAEMQTKEDLENAISYLDIFSGDFLSRMSAEMWIMPIQTYYRNLFMASAGEVLPILLELKRYDIAVDICKRGIAVDPVNETLYGYYMQALQGMGKQKDAINLYRQLSDRLLTDYGIIPGDEIREVYRNVTKIVNDHALTVDMLQSQLKEEDSGAGALICEYDFFRILYHYLARSMARNGIAVHIALVSVTGRNQKELSGQKLEKVMKNLEGSICLSLRRGDSAARCSATQYVILLPQANYENSCMVCERIFKSYFSKHSYADANLRYEVCALEPDDKENFKWIQDRFSK